MLMNYMKHLFRVLIPSMILCYLIQCFSCKSKISPPNIPRQHGCLNIRFKPWSVDKPYSDICFHTSTKCPDSLRRWPAEYVDFLIGDSVLAQLLICAPSHSDIIEAAHVKDVMDNINGFCELETLFIPDSGTSKILVLNNLGKDLKQYIVCMNAILKNNGLNDAYSFLRSIEAGVEQRATEK